MNAGMKMNLSISPEPVIRSPFLRWGLLALVQLVLIAVPLADRLEVQMSGTPIVLDLRPVDPRDLLRGDYVIIDLSLTRISKDVDGAGNDFEIGDTVYVGLGTNPDGVAVPRVVTAKRGDAGDLAIEGTVKNTVNGELILDYGISAFFLPEGEGLVIENLEIGRVQLVAALAQDGRSVPVKLLVDGKEFKSDAAF